MANPTEDMMLACQFGIPAMLRDALGKGAKVNHCDEHGSNAMLECLRGSGNKDVECLSIVLENGCNPFSVDHRNREVFGVAIKGRNSAAFSLLVAAAERWLGSNKDRSELEEAYVQALHACARADFADGIKILAQARTPLDERIGRWGMSALHVAVEEGKPAAAAALLACGANIEIKDDGGRLCIDFASGECLSILRAFQEAKDIGLAAGQAKESISSRLRV